MKPLLFQIKSQINQREFKICFSLLLLLSIGGFLSDCFRYYHCGYMQIRSAADNFLLVSTSSRAFSMVFTLIFPLVSAALCAGCRRKNEKNGDGLFSMLRMHKRKYILGNAAAAVLITAGTIFLILLINQLLCLISFPVTGFDNRFGLPHYLMAAEYESGILLDFWKIQSPYFYNFLYIVMISFLGGGIALLTYGICFLKRLQKLTSIQIAVLVFALFALMEAIGQLFPIPMFHYLSFVETDHAASFSQYIIFTAVLYGTGIILSLKGMKQYEFI